MNLPEFPLRPQRDIRPGTRFRPRFASARDTHRTHLNRSGSALGPPSGDGSLASVQSILAPFPRERRAFSLSGADAASSVVRTSTDDPEICEPASSFSRCSSPGA